MTSSTIHTIALTSGVTIWLVGLLISINRPNDIEPANYIVGGAAVVIMGAILEGLL